MPALPQLAAFLYHDVADDPRESGLQRPAALRYKHARTEFEQNLDALASAPVGPSLLNAIDFVSGGHHVLLTFDDGGKSVLYVSERLNERGWKAHFFITTGAIGKPTFLAWRDVSYLRSCGHVIGSHSHTHPDIFKMLSPARMLEEWRVSRDMLEQALGEACTAASVPGGDSSRKVYESAAQCGIQHLFTSDPTLVPRKISTCWVIGRFVAKAGTPVSRIEALAQFKGWRRELLVRQSKVLLRTLLAPAYRTYVARTTREWTNGAAGSREQAPLPSGSIAAGGTRRETAGRTGWQP